MRVRSSTLCVSMQLYNWEEERGGRRGKERERMSLTHSDFGLI
jgi:hypothetical protein